MFFHMQSILVIISFWCLVARCDDDDDDDKYKTIHTLFSQGMWASRGQAAKYCRSGIEVQGKRVTYDGANDIIHNPVDYPELPQVSYEWAWNPVHILMQATAYLKTWIYGSHNDTAYHLLFDRIDVAGPQEVTHHRESWLAYNSEMDKLVHGNLVLFGTSRGAATTFVSVAISEPHDRRHLRLVVLEAPFDSVENALKHRWGEDAQPHLLHWLKQWTNYTENFESPARVAWRFPLDVPVAFVTSAVDHVVHRNRTQYLIDILKTRGHPHLHHLLLNHSGHSDMSLGQGPDQQAYVQFMSGLYDRYVLLPTTGKKEHPGESGQKEKEEEACTTVSQ